MQTFKKHKKHEFKILFTSKSPNKSGLNFCKLKETIKKYGFNFLQASKKSQSMNLIVGKCKKTQKTRIQLFQTLKSPKMVDLIFVSLKNP